MTKKAQQDPATLARLPGVTRQGVRRPPRIMLYGEHKIGKSTFASQAPNPVFIQTEDGLDNLQVDAFPLATAYSDVIAAIGMLYNEAHDYKTVVLDSMDWLEKLIWKEVCASGGVDNIEKYEKGYGKGYIAALNWWREVLDGLNALRTEKGVGVICLCHAEIRRFESPEVDPYDRYQPKLQNKATSIVSEWADVIGFANMKVATTAVETKFSKEKKYRGVSTGERVLFLEQTAAMMAGNRYGLPKTLPFTWEAFSNALNATPINDEKEGEK